MANLYQQLAPIYEAMYQTFINYEEEFQFYSQIIQHHQCQTVLEIGSGTGHLSQRFITAGFDYTGLDYSAEMIRIAQKKYPNIRFRQGDMRNFKLEHPVESIIITARTISYLIKNKEVNAMLQSVHHNLCADGILCFDFIDANRFIPAIDKNQTIIHQATYQGQHYQRESRWTVNLDENWTFDWQSDYYKIVQEQAQKVGHDTSTVRTFTLNDIQLFLRLNNFEVIQIIDRATYAFDTFVVVAIKK